MDEERRTVLRTLNKLANDYLVYPDETKALDYAIKELETSSWHPYPKEKPDSLKNYLITMHYPVTDKYDIRVGWFGDWGWHIEDELYSDEVIAWAELPKPYKEGA